MKISLLICLAFYTIAANSQTNYALNLNGINQYISIGAPVSSSSSYTKEAWVYATTLASARNIISSENAPFWINAGILSGGQGGNYSVVTDGAAFPLNRWVHVALVYDAGTTTLLLYRDGILVSTNNSVGAYSSENIFIGSHQGASSYLQGSVDEVRIWNIALTQTQLKQNMYKGPAGNASGLVAYYKCNDGIGATLTNSTGGTNGDLQNSPAWVASPVQLSPNGLHFDGTDDVVVIPHIVSSAFTVECWMNTTSTGPGGSQWFHGNGIVDAEVGGVATDWGIALLQNKVTFGVGLPDRTIQSTTNVNSGNWVHVAASWQQSNGEMKLYINGIQEATTTGSTALRSAPSRITFGQLQTNIQRYNGTLDEVRIWNGVRSQAQIQANMNKELDPTTEASLAAYYTFNQGITSGTNTGVTILTDMKNTNNGTLSNFALSGSSSNFVMQKADLTVLPIQWHSFTAEKQGETTLLKWSTASEENTKEFIVQHSQSGINWSNAGIVTAAGNSNTITTYSFIHTTPQKGLNYYRILQMDIDGRNSYSEIRTLPFKSDKFFVVLNNPVRTGTINIRLYQPAALMLYSSDGRLLRQQWENSGVVTMNVSGYAKGIYWLKANGETQKIVLQ